MSYVTNRLSGAFVLCAALTTAAAAAGLDSHVHGVTALNLVIEDDELAIELIAPGADIVGFEHAPETVAEREKVSSGVDRLRDGLVIFALPAAANCRLEDVEIASGMLEPGTHSDGDHAEHDHDEDGHSEDDHEKDPETGEDHAEFHAHYHFHCADPTALTHVDLMLFKQFPTMTEVNAQVISPSGQTAARLTKESNRLRF